MNIGRLNEECPKCGSKDKTVKRDFDAEFKAHATTESVSCSECGHIFVKGKKQE
ncbi:MAG TPA: TIGR04165 family Cys-rich peptide [Methanobacterium sp.]|nr:TIGR04165 family Cys-rich peptide [Methanobacterium sp.]